MSVALHVHLPSGSALDIAMEGHELVERLKEKVASVAGLKTDTFLLMFEGEELRGEQHVWEQPFEDQSDLEVVPKKDTELEAHFEKLVNLKEEHSGDHQDIVTTLAKIAFRCKMRGDTTTALQYCTEALDMAGRIDGNSISTASLLSLLGSIQKAAKDYTTALQTLHAAMEMRKSIDANIGSSHYNIGHVHRRLEEYPMALHHYKQALTIRRNSNSRMKPVYYTSIAKAYLAMGDNNAALTHYLLALDIVRRDRPSVAFRMVRVADIYEAMGDTDKALVYLVNSLEMLRRIDSVDHRPIIATTSDRIAQLSHDAGNLATAAEYRSIASEMRGCQD
eukprot:TRINITY_DN11384_c0_g1_i3.p1 TRINITY_DN11384_c0_g1~~TRINITY_DN11384_c0_g1_i3.p1  ORF type:complete len:335 (+),score=68.88 TRINITY_DN11384_c0_g1_i3:45-1049(+)